MFEIAYNMDDHTVLMNSEYFTDDFIRDQKIFIWGIITDQDGEKRRIILSRDPAQIRSVLANQKMLYAIPSIAVINGNHHGRRELYLRHDFIGMEIDPLYENGAMEYLHFAWGRPVHFETYQIVEVNGGGNITQYQPIVHHYDGKEHKIEEKSIIKVAST